MDLRRLANDEISTGSGRVDVRVYESTIKTVGPWNMWITSVDFGGKQHKFDANTIWSVAGPSVEWVDGFYPE